MSDNEEQLNFDVSGLPGLQGVTYDGNYADLGIALAGSAAPIHIAVNNTVAAGETVSDADTDFDRARDDLIAQFEAEASANGLTPEEVESVVGPLRSATNIGALMAAAADVRAAMQDRIGERGRDAMDKLEDGIRAFQLEQERRDLARDMYEAYGDRADEAAAALDRAHNAPTEAEREEALQEYYAIGDDIGISREEQDEYLERYRAQFAQQTDEQGRVTRPAASLQQTLAENTEEFEQENASFQGFGAPDTVVAVGPNDDEPLGAAATSNLARMSQSGGLSVPG